MGKESQKGKRCDDTVCAAMEAQRRGIVKGRVIILASTGLR